MKLLPLPCTSSTALDDTYVTFKSEDDGPQLQNWMSQFPDECLLSSLWLPGTHESCALYGFASQCQEQCIPWQLRNGVRFLDLRLALIKGTLKVYHGVVSQKKTAEALFEEIYAFLGRSPSECVICSVMQENASVDLFQELMDEIIAANPKRWFLDNRFPSLGEARGKIVLFSRYGRGPRLGIHPPSWPNNSKSIFSYSIGQVQVYTQDWYMPYGFLAIPEKFAAVTQLFRLPTPQPSFKLDFCSAASYLSGTPKTVALGFGFRFFGVRGVNHRLQAFLEGLAPEDVPPGGGCFMLDMVGEPRGLVERIVALNERVQSMGLDEKEGSEA